MTGQELKSNALIPVTGLITGELPVASFNPFQMRLFLYLHKNFDQIVYLHARSKQINRRQDRQLSPYHLKESMMNIIQANDAISLVAKGAELLAYSVYGASEFEEFAKLFIRGALGIGDREYMGIHTYFETYARGLPTGDVENQAAFDDQRFLSKRILFPILQNQLDGVYLSVMGFTDAETYSNAKWTTFIHSAKERTEKLLLQEEFSL